MISLLEFFQDLTNPALGFLPRALLAAVLSSVVCGLVGTHVVLRGMSFVGDALSHAVFPGIAIAFATGTSLVLGGAVAGMIVALAIALASQNRRVSEDSLIGISFAAAFALGLVIISRVPGYTGSLESFLFGSLAGVSDVDLLTSAGVGLVILAVTAVAHRSLVACSLDREFARAQGVRVMATELVLYAVVAATVVISVRTIGNILVLALLVTPAATARLLTDRLGVMMAVGPAIGAVSAFLGIYFSWAWDVPTGASIVLVVTFFFILAWFLGPRGVLTQHLTKRNK